MHAFHSKVQFCRLSGKKVSYQSLSLYAYMHPFLSTSLRLSPRRVEVSGGGCTTDGLPLIDLMLLALNGEESTSAIMLQP
jgi:hypothetical protein